MGRVHPGPAAVLSDLEPGERRWPLEDERGEPFAVGAKPGGGKVRIDCPPSGVIILGPQSQAAFDKAKAEAELHAGLGIRYTLIPVRVPAGAMPVLASERRFAAGRGHPLDPLPCPACGKPLGEAVTVLIVAGIAPEDRKPAGATTAGTVAVHAACAGVPDQEPEGQR